MSISKLAMIVYFAAVCINTFWSHPVLVIVAGVAAGVAAIALIADK